MVVLWNLQQLSNHMRLSSQLRSYLPNSNTVVNAQRGRINKLTYKGISQLGNKKDITGELISLVNSHCS